MQYTYDLDYKKDDFGRFIKNEGYSFYNKIYNYGSYYIMRYIFVSNIKNKEHNYGSIEIYVGN